MADYSLITALSDDCNDGKFDLEPQTPLMALPWAEGKVKKKEDREKKGLQQKFWWCSDFHNQSEDMKTFDLSYKAVIKRAG